MLLPLSSDGRTLWSKNTTTMARLIFLCYLLNCVLGGPILETSLGEVHGVYSRVLGVNIEAYLGIPYAIPPIGMRRYTFPQPFGFFEDRNLNATEFPPACPQTTLNEKEVLGEGESEDCLYLNVFRQSGTRREDFKGVLVVIHGGGFVQGSSADIHQSAEALVALGDVIVVSFNYRLGVLGFADFNSHAPSNLGLWDQRTALSWVRDHICDYGGDPEEITLIGTSSGSMSIAAHLITQVDKKKLFRSVIMDAGVLTSSMLLEDTTTSYRRINKIAYELGCPLDSPRMVDCLQEASLEDLIRVSTSFLTDNGIATFVPTAEGVYIPHRTEIFVEEQQLLVRKVRMMIGYALDEGTMFVGSDTLPFDPSRVRSRAEVVEHCRKVAVKFNYPIDFNLASTRFMVGEFYAEQHFTNPFAAVSEFLGDGSFKCPINNFIKAYSLYNKEVYVYQFERRLEKTYSPMYDPGFHGVFHTSPYLHFSGSLLLLEHDLDPIDQEFVLDSMKMITDFVNSRDTPSFRGMQWPRYSETGKILILNDTVRARKGLPSDYKCRELFTSPHELGRPWVKPEL